MQPHKRCSQQLAKVADWACRRASGGTMHGTCIESLFFNSHIVLRNVSDLGVPADMLWETWYP